MVELMHIKDRIAAERYRDANSSFELRMILMDVASLLTKKHIVNLRQGKDADISMKLLQAFRSVKQHYFVLEKADYEDQFSFNKTRDLVVAELGTLLHHLKDNVVQMEPVLSIAQ
jgi:hypothetical protein